MIPLRRRSLPKAAAIAALTALAATGCYDSGFRSPDPSQTEESVTQTIAGLKDRFLGTPFVVETDIAVAGVVTSSDQAQNFYRTICIEENGTALEIMAGIDRLHNDFPIGCRVALHLKGLTVAESRGVLQVGKAPAPGSGYDTDYIGSKAELDRILVRTSERILPPVPTPMSIPELTVGRCGTLVRIEGLHYDPEELAESAWSGYKNFSDKDGNSVCTYVRNYAAFAGNDVPVGEVALTGILQYDNTGEGRFLLKLRDENDCVH